GRVSWTFATLSALLLLPQAVQPLPYPNSTAQLPGAVARALTPPGALVRALALDAGALSVPRREIASRLASVAARAARAVRPMSDLGSWVPAIAQLAGGGPAHAAVAHALVTDMFERLHVPLNPHSLDYLLKAPAKHFAVDYPGAIAAPSPNFWRARRFKKRSIPIRYAVIHDTEGACASALNWLTNPVAYGSAHFLVCRDGRIYQLVHVADAAWHAGNTYINYSSIGIEHEGFAGSPFTDAQYRATADLLRWLNTHLALHLNWTRNTVFGHENVPDGGHVDPG